jgi:hypothetical protein
MEADASTYQAQDPPAVMSDDGCLIWRPDRQRRAARVETSALARLLGVPMVSKLTQTRSCGNDLCVRLEHIPALGIGSMDEDVLEEAHRRSPSIEEYLGPYVWTPVRHQLVDIAFLAGGCDFCVVARAMALHEIMDRLTSDPRDMLWLSTRWLAELGRNSSGERLAPDAIH